MPPLDSSQRLTVVRWTERLLWAPGVLIFGALWLATVVPFDYRTATSADMDFLWQSLGLGFLSQDPLASLSVLHIQPPGLNALFALDLAITPDSHTFLLVIFAIAVGLTIVMLTDAIRRVTGSRAAALGAGVIYALLPATVLYALYAYNTTITAFFAIATIWPLTFIKTRPTVSLLMSSSAVLGLVLTRSTFIWLFMLVWVIALLWWGIKRTGIRTASAIAAAGAPLLVALALQLHYSANFGIPFMSSWSGQNMAKALQVSGKLNITDEAQDSLAAMPCESAVLSAWQQGQLNIWDPGGTLRQPGCEALPVPSVQGILAWDNELKANSTEMNFNERRALAASGVWSRLMNTIVLADPWQLPAMAVMSNEGISKSGVGLYLTRADDYPFLDSARQFLPTANVLAPLASLFAPLAWLLVIIGGLFALIRKHSRLRVSAPFWFAFGLLVFHAAASTLLEYSENMRYRAEIDPVLMFAAVAALLLSLPAKRP